MSTQVKSTSQMPGFGQGFIGDKEKWLPALRHLQETITFMIAEERMTGSDGTSYLVPSWGTAGMRLATTPIFAFDRPELVPYLGDTMSTDMTHIFIYLPFLEELIEEWKKEDTYGLAITLVHEMNHMLMNHGLRGDVMKEAYDHRTMNIAMDIEIDIPIYDDFHHRYPLGTWTLTNTPAYKDGKPNPEYRDLTFEEMCSRVEEEMNKRREEAKKQMQQAKDQMKGPKGKPDPNGQPGDPNQDSDDEAPGEDGKPSDQDNDASGKDAKGDPKPGENGKPGGDAKGGSNGENDADGNGKPQGQGGKRNADTDMKDGGIGGYAEPKMADIKNTEDLVKGLTELSEQIGDKSILESLVRAGILNQKDLDDVRDAVANGKELPDSVKQGIKQIEDTSRSQSRQVIQNAAELNERLGGKMPGAHSLQSMVTRIRADEEVDIDYESAISKRIKSIGEHRVTDANKMNSLCYLRHQDLGLKKRMPYLPGKTMAKETVRVAACVDTSGSMSEDRDLPDALGALMRLAKQRNAEIYIYSVDTVIRNYPTLLTANLIEKVKKEGAEVLGRGGTSIENGLYEVFRRNSADDMSNAIDISEGTDGKRAKKRGGGLGSSSLGGGGLGKKNKEFDYDLVLYLSDFEDHPPRMENFTPEQIHNTILLATSRTPKSQIRMFRDAGWTAYGIGKDKKINLDLNMKM